MKTTREALIEATARLRFALPQVPEDQAKELLRAIQIIVKVRNSIEAGNDKDNASGRSI